MKMRLFITSFIPIFVATACTLVLDVGMEQTPSAQPVTITPSLTFTASPSPTPLTPTFTPSPTPLPGSVVIPISSMSSTIPWLDETKRPTVFVTTFNISLPPFDNPLVRQAFAASIDKEVIVQMAKDMYAVNPFPATTVIPPQTLGRDLYGQVGIKFDPVHARDLLTQAGYTDPSSFPTVTFIVHSYGDIAPGARYNMATKMAEMWKIHLGVTVEVQALTRESFRNRIYDNPPELIWFGWTVNPGNDPDFIRPIYRTDGEFNQGHFSSPDFDTLVTQAYSSSDPVARQILYIEAERILCETEAGVIPLYFAY